MDQHKMERLCDTDSPKAIYFAAVMWGKQSCCLLLSLEFERCISHAWPSTNWMLQIWFRSELVETMLGFTAYYSCTYLLLIVLMQSSHNYDMQRILYGQLHREIQFTWMQIWSIWSGYVWSIISHPPLQRTLLCMRTTAPWQYKL